MTDNLKDAPFSEEEIALAASNYEAQEWLFRALDRAASMLQITTAELAESLELDEDTAEAWLSGEHDLRMSELRHLANAVDARITYKVEPIRTAWVDRMREMEQRLDWKDTTKFWSDRSTPSPV